MNSIQCDASGIEMAENLRTFAERIERGEVIGLAVCVTYPPESGCAVGTAFWTCDKTGSLFALVAGTAVLAARTVQAFGPE